MSSNHSSNKAMQWRAAKDRIIVKSKEFAKSQDVADWKILLMLVYRRDASMIPTMRAMTNSGVSRLQTSRTLAARSSKEAAKDKRLEEQIFDKEPESN